MRNIIYKEPCNLWTQLTSVLILPNLILHLIYLDKDFKYGSTREPVVVHHHW